MSRSTHPVPEEMQTLILLSLKIFWEPSFTLGRVILRGSEEQEEAFSSLDKDLLVSNYVWSQYTRQWRAQQAQGKIAWGGYDSFRHGEQEPSTS